MPLDTESFDDNPVIDALCRAFVAVIDAARAEEQAVCGASPAAAIEARDATDQRMAAFGGALRDLQQQRCRRVAAMPGLVLWDIATKREPAHA